MLFSDLFVYLSNNTLSRAELSNSGKVRNIHYGDVLIKYGEVIDIEHTEIPYVADVSRLRKPDYLSTGDVVIADTAEDDTVGKAVEIINNSSVAVVSGLHTIPCRPKKRFVPSYLGYYVNSAPFHTQLHPYMQGIKVTSISKGNIGKTYISSPDLEEQQKITSLLNLLSSRIEKQRQLVEALKSYKRGALSKLFPKKGETTPEYRFAGFTDPWEQRKLGELAEIVGGGTPSTSNPDYWDGDIDWYAPAEIADQIYMEASQRKITEQGYENSSAKLLPPGTVLFTSRAGIGKTAILTRKGCTNQGFQSIVPHQGELDSYFIFSRTEELKRYGETVGAGSTFVEVSGKQMANMDLMMPQSAAEQQAIGTFFRHLDHLITLHQRKQSEYENVKTGLMQQLLI